MVSTEQRQVDRQRNRDRQRAQHAARESLRGQLAHLERQLALIVVEGYPYLRAAPHAGHGPREGIGDGPRLLDLGELERRRDRLIAQLHDARRRTARRAQRERRARALLEAMRLEPGRYRFVRLPVADLGEGGCGVWEVRPRLGLIGMLAGWWQLTLSSGCP